MCCGPVDTWEKAFALFIGAIFLIMAVFLGIDSFLGTNNNAIAIHALNAKGSECAPSLGDGDGFGIGELRANLNTKSFDWDIVYDKLDLIIWLRISGPVGATTTKTGPVVIWLCGGDAADTCDLSVAHRVSGTLTENSAGAISPRAAVEQIAQRPAFYYLEFGTAAFPNCALRAQLGLTSGPGQWGW